jgi:hypothetical protein
MVSQKMTIRQHLSPEEMVPSGTDQADYRFYRKMKPL